ncbi:MAG: ATP-binding protein [Anaerolineales bacterium]|nr:ATP-binding protein [Anaerolineales bacterium]
MKNPHIERRLVFVGRREVFDAIGRVFRDPQENAILLYGQRCIGKTSFLQELADWLPKAGGYRVLYINLQSKAALSLSRVLEELARAIAAVLGLPSPDLGDNPELTLRRIWPPAILEKLPKRLPGGSGRAQR